MNFEALLRVIDQRQAETARNAMEQATDRPEYDFGRASGVYEGLEIAKGIIVDIYRDAKERDRKL